MYKCKTHKGLAKRVKVTRNGKVRFKRSFQGHLMSSRSSKRRRVLRAGAAMAPAMAKKTIELLGGISSAV